jgi:hypothetical protein
MNEPNLKSWKGPTLTTPPPKKIKETPHHKKKIPSSYGLCRNAFLNEESRCAIPLTNVLDLKVLPHTYVLLDGGRTSPSTHLLM